MLRFVLPLLILLPSTAQAAPPAASPARIAEFEKHVRPLLIRRCYSCHSSRATPPKGGLRLDTRQGWQTGGDSGTAIRPGRPDQRLLIRAIRYRDDSLQMPPKQNRPAEEIRILERWITNGAVDPRTGNPSTGRRGTGDHWAFQPLSAQRTTAEPRTAPVL